MTLGTAASQSTPLHSHQRASYLNLLSSCLSKTPVTPLIPFFTSIPQKGRGVPRHTHFLGTFALKRYLGDNGKQPSGEGGHTPWQCTEQVEGHTNEETHLCFCVTR